MRPIFVTRLGGRSGYVEGVLGIRAADVCGQIHRGLGSTPMLLSTNLGTIYFQDTSSSVHRANLVVERALLRAVWTGNGVASLCAGRLCAGI
jgi:hypothetical protein